MDNELHLAKSLYLQQHKDNPVHWKQWRAAIWEEATKKNKLVIVSIGYSSCHWCHVMERESFEKQEVADVMNAHFTSIKVDREERPDIDNIYMTAVQLMSGQGGWPLNVVCLPDKRPIWGGTYFPQEKWEQALLQIHRLYQQNPEKVIAYADELQNGLRSTELLPQPNGSSGDDTWLVEREKRVLEMRDREWGGYNRAPKFPMPYEQLFHLMAAQAFDLPEMQEHVLRTLTKMAYGGIYDVVGGGFCRYAVDGRWKVPHFEKMLYDNAQLLSAFSIAQRHSPNSTYYAVIEGINTFLQSALKTSEGLYQSAIDADSEGEEGKYYTWLPSELASICGDDYEILKAVYELDDLWEGRCILFRIQTNEQASTRLNIGVNGIEAALDRAHQALLEARKKRVSPATDDKVIAGWNGLLVSGFVEAYLATGNPLWKAQAESLVAALERYLHVDGTWHRIYAGDEAYVTAQLEDIGALAQGYMKLYNVTGNEHYYTQAGLLIAHAVEEFSDDEALFFYTTSQHDEEVIQRSRDLEDNVIPSPNALIADAIRMYTTIHHDDTLDKRWRKMTRHAAHISAEVKTGFYLWGMLYLQLNHSKEWVVSGSKAESVLQDITPEFHDFFTEMVVLKENKEHDLFRGRYGQEVRHFVCEDRVCHRPTTSTDEARQRCR